MLVPEFTEDKRLELYNLGRDSLFFFAKGILRMKDLAEKPHLDWCEKLDGRGDWGPDWRRGIVAAARGFLKTSLATIAFSLHRSIYRPNWAVRIIGSSSDNVRINIFDPMLNLFGQGPDGESEHSRWLFWLYRSRIPEEFAGWNTEQLSFIRTDPLAKPSVTYKGIGSDQEGWHGDCVIIDDPEGADADKVKSVNVDAKRVIDNAVPLLADPATGQVLVVNTSHGNKPVLYEILEDDKGRIEWDNTKRDWKIIFVPIVDAEGNPSWPDRYPAEQIRFIKATTDPIVLERQFYLRKYVASGSLFSKEAVVNGFAKWLIPQRIIEYPVLLFDQDKWYKKGEWVTKTEQRQVRVEHLRYYLHVDPKHREDTIDANYSGTSRPSRAAQVVVGLAPDGHAFVMGIWSDDVGLEPQVRQVYRAYQTWGPHSVTFDPVGAQVWFRSYCSMLERSDMRFRLLQSSGRYSAKRILPSLVGRLVEDKRSTREDKVDVIYNRLSPLINACMLHFFPSNQDELLHQVYGFPDNTTYVDLVDALAQGPPVWQPPARAELAVELKRSQKLLIQVASKYTGYAAPYAPRGIDTSRAGSRKPR